MAKKQESKAQDNAFKGFYNPVLNADIKLCVNKLALDPTQTMSRIFGLVDAGFKFSLTVDKANNTFICSLMDKRIGSTSAGYVMSVKHSDINKVIAIVYFLVDEFHAWGSWTEFLDVGVEDW